ARVAILEVLGDDRGVVDDHVAVYQHGHLPPRAHGQKLRGLRPPEGLATPRHLAGGVVEALLGERDADLGTERAQRTGPQLLVGPPPTRTDGGGLPRREDPHVRAPTPTACCTGATRRCRVATRMGASPPLRRERGKQ